ncbi:hypothetical protein JCM15519_16310 [Fundidesulfovibrio butyratiphilus]
MSSRFPPLPDRAVRSSGRPAACASPTGPGLASLYPAKDTALAVGLTLCVFVVAHFSALVSPLVINDDVRQQLFWMQRWRDPALYPPDLLNMYAQAYVPWGGKALYRLGAVFCNPVQFSKAVAAVLFVAQGIFLMGLGRFLGGRTLAWGALASVWVMPFFLDNISGGLSRGFASPSLAALALAWLLRNARLACLALAVQALFIPYIFAPCALAVMAERIYAWFRSRPGLMLNTRAQWVCFVFCAGAVLAFTALFSLKGFGPLVRLADAAARPEFGPKGRLDLAPLPHPFLDFVYFPFEGVGLFKEWGLAGGILTLALLAWPVWLGARRIAWTEYAAKAASLGWLAGAFLLFYVVARMTAFALFVPDRYVQYPMNLLYALLLSACCAATWRIRPRGRAAACLVVAGLALFGALRLRNVGLYDLRADAPLYAGVEAQTPKEAMVAGHPGLMDNVLTFSKRNAFATFELAHCWSVGYWTDYSKRLTAFFDAYYAKDPETVRRFAAEQGVDFLVVQPAHFTPEYLAGEPFFEPYGHMVRTMTRDRRDFAVFDQDLFPRIPLAPGAFLIDLRPWRDQGKAP